MSNQRAETELRFKDYFLILQLHPEADAAMVDTAYWHLARRYNDAAATDPSARAELDDLNEAYSVLGSPELREEYGKIRNAVLGVGTLPAPPPPVPEPPPLAVMKKQRPRVREDVTLPRPRRPQLNFGQVNVPSWQNALAALIILVLATAALMSWAHPALVAALLVIGIALTTFPLVRRLPTVLTLTLRRPTIRAPHVPPRRPAGATLDPEALRQSTEAMLARWREGPEPEGVVLATSSKSQPPAELSNTSNDEGSRA